jgi:hypothetical protein
VTGVATRSLFRVDRLREPALFHPDPELSTVRKQAPDNELKPQAFTVEAAGVDPNSELNVNENREERS